MQQATIEPALAIILLACVIAVLIHRGVMEYGKWRTRDHRRRRGEGARMALYAKVRRIHANLTALHTYIEAAISQAWINGARELWRSVPPVADAYDHVSLTADEISSAKPVWSAAEMNQLARLDSIYSGAINGWDEYCRLHAELAAMAPVKAGGDVASALLSHEQNRLARSKIADLEILIEALREHLPNDVAQAAAAAERLRETLGLRNTAATSGQMAGQRRA